VCLSYLALVSPFLFSSLERWVFELNTTFFFKGIFLSFSKISHFDWEEDKKILPLNLVSEERTWRGKHFYARSHWSSWASNMTCYKNESSVFTLHFTWEDGETSKHSWNIKWRTENLLLNAKEISSFFIVITEIFRFISSVLGFSPWGKSFGSWIRSFCWRYLYWWCLYWWYLYCAYLWRSRKMKWRLLIGNGWCCEN